VGKHYFQYRYKDSRTGYVSDPSNLIAVTVAASGEEVTFSVAASGTGNVNRSGDGKVDTIVLEATLVNGSVFYVVDEIDNSIPSTVVFDISDASLSEKVLPYSDTGHAPPPVFRCVASHKGRLWGLGSVRHEIGTVAATNGSANLVGTGTGWTAASVARLLHFQLDNVSYEVASFTDATHIALTSNFAGTTASGLGYIIVPKSPNLLFCSAALFPESWPVLSFIDTLKEMNDVATAIIPFGNQLLICGSHSMERLTYSLEPFLTIDGRMPDGQLFPVSRSRGAMNPNCVIEVEGKIYGWDQSGVWVWEGAQPRRISDAVDFRFRSAVTSTTGAVNSPHISWHANERKLRFHFGVGSANINDYAEFDLDTGAWGMGGHHTSILCSTEYADPIEGMTSVYGDNLGYLWMPDRGNLLEGVLPNDLAGSPSTITTVVGTVAASPIPNATTFSISEGNLDSFSSVYPADASFTGMSGAPVYSVGLGESGIVLSNTATEVTMHSAFSTAPAVGSTIYFGTINASLLTRSFGLDDRWEISSPRYIHLYFAPGATDYTLGLHLYPDSTGAYTDWATYSENGVAFTAGSSRIVVKTDATGTGAQGYRKIPIGSKSWRKIQILIEVYKPTENIYQHSLGYYETTGPSINRIDVDGYTAEYPVDVA
jgi:hypothetical protein